MSEPANEPMNDQVGDQVGDQAGEPLASTILEISATAAKPEQLGFLLRKAREARGLTVADVVATLKFSQRQIDALELGDIGSLPGNVFVRGFVRSYARFLKLDAAPLLELLNDEAPVMIAEVRPPADMGVAMPRTETRQVSLLVAVAVVATIAAAAGAVWHFLAPVPKPVVATAEQAVVELPAPVQPAPEKPAETPIAPALVVAPAIVPAEGQNAPATPVVAPDVAHAPKAGTASPISVANGRQLSFEFHGVSWVEVKDASKRTIFTGQYVNGNRQAAVGQPPFQIVIGNAPQVDLKYDGRSVDLKPFTRADVARLTLE